MKTVAAFSKPFEAHMLIARLEASGVAAFARDENMVTLDWLASNAIGGVKVDVADEDYERALAILREPESAAATPSGSSPQTRVAELDRKFKRALLFFVAGALPLGILAYFLTPAPKPRAYLLFEESEAPDFRPMAAAVAGVLGGCLAVWLANRKKPERSPEPTAPSGDGSA